MTTSMWWKQVFGKIYKSTEMNAILPLWQTRIPAEETQDVDPDIDP